MERPRITLKLATSMDGRIALANGESQWITSSDSRARVHRMRAEHDAILIGAGTLAADDPLLTARSVPLPARQPVRLVADSRLRTPVHSRLVQSAGLGRVALVCSDPTTRHADAIKQAGAEVWQVTPDKRGRVSPRALLERCAVERLETVFLEGGGLLAASFLRMGLVDKMYWFRAPIILGGDGIPAIGAMGLHQIQAAPRWRTAATERIGDDVLETYVRCKAATQGRHA